MTDAESPRQADVDAVISRLLDEGEIVSQGEFTMDREQARRKMEQFQFADPRRYVLEFVQAAVLKQARRIDVAVDADDLHMVHDGLPYTLEDFEELYGAVFSNRADDATAARQQMALGLSAATRLRPRRIRVVSVQGEEGVELLVRRGKPEQYRVVKGVRMKRTGGGPEPTTWIHVKSRLRLRILTRFIENLLETLPEELLLRKRCSFATNDIYLEGRKISLGMQLADAVGVTEVLGGYIRGVVGFSAVDDQCLLHLIKDDVWITTHELRGVEPGFVAVVNGPDLKKDISQTDVIRDEAYHELRRCVDQARATSLSENDIPRLRRDSLNGKVGRELGEIYKRFERSFDLSGRIAKGTLWAAGLVFPEVGIGTAMIARAFISGAGWGTTVFFGLLPYILAGLTSGFCFLLKHTLIRSATRRAADRIGRGSRERTLLLESLSRKASEGGDKSFSAHLRQRLKRHNPRLDQ